MGIHHLCCVERSVPLSQPAWCLLSPSQPRYTPQTDDARAPTALLQPPFSHTVNPKPLQFVQSANRPSCHTADFVQELYLKELKAYKPTPVKDSDAVGQVATFSLPKTPKSPEESDLASSLKEYESMAVEVEGQEAVAADQPAAVVEDWLVDEEEDDAHAAAH